MVFITTVAARGDAAVIIVVVARRRALAVGATGTAEAEGGRHCHSRRGK